MYISDDDINSVTVLMNYFKLAGNITWICVESSGFCCVFLPLKFICRYKMYKHFRQRKKNQCHLSKIRLLLSEFYACVKKIHLKIIFKRFLRLLCHTYIMNIVFVWGNKVPYIIKFWIDFICQNWHDIEHNFCECDSVYLNDSCNVWFGVHDSNIITFKNKFSTRYFHIEKIFFTRKKCIINEYAIFLFCFVCIHAIIARSYTMLYPSIFCSKCKVTLRSKWTR